MFKLELPQPRRGDATAGPGRGRKSDTQAPGRLKTLRLFLEFLSLFFLVRPPYSYKRGMLRYSATPLF